jgi:23S rRNA pseudouridine1911/1915/1917 synthase
MNVNKVTVDEKNAGQRLDIFIASRFPEQSRSVLQRAIKSGSVSVNGKPAKPRYLVKAGDVVTVPADMSAPESPASAVVEAPELALPILYEDKDVVVINKPAGILVHPAPGSREATVAHWFAGKFRQLADAGGGYVQLPRRISSCANNLKSIM